MDKNMIINRIIEEQTKKSKIFVKVANRKDLEKLTIGELCHVLFISENVSQD